MQDDGANRDTQPPIQLESSTVMVVCSVIEAYSAAANGRKARQELQVWLIRGVLAAGVQDCKVPCACLQCCTNPRPSLMFCTRTQVQVINSTALEIMSYTSQWVSVTNTTLSCAGSNGGSSTSTPTSSLVSQSTVGAIKSSASAAERVKDVLAVAAALPAPVATHFYIPASAPLTITSTSWPPAGMLLRGMTVTLEGDPEVTSIVDMHSTSHVGGAGFFGSMGTVASTLHRMPAGVAAPTVSFVRVSCSNQCTWRKC